MALKHGHKLLKTNHHEESETVYRHFGDSDVHAKPKRFRPRTQVVTVAEKQSGASYLFYL